VEGCSVRAKAGLFLFLWLFIFILILIFIIPKRAGDPRLGTGQSWARKAPFRSPLSGFRSLEEEEEPEEEEEYGVKSL
jgi:hypothetical protein